MKKILPVLIFFGAMVYLYWFLTSPRITPIYLSSTDQFLKQEKPQPIHEIFHIVASINEKNANIKSFYVNNVQIRFKQGGITANVYGELALEKEKNFRLIINHRLSGKEIDIGSNKTNFWFWSKRMKPPVLHYALHEELDKTMLRTALNPIWMMESFNVDSINIENIKIAKFKENWAIIQERMGTMGESTTVLILIDPQQKLVIGRYLYNQDGKLIASAEYQNFSGNIPQKILIMWYEEKIILDLNLSKTQVNVDINPKFWIMPKMKNKINMAE